MYRCSHPIIPIIRCAPVLDFTNRYLQLLCCHQHPSHPDNLQLPPRHTMQAKIFDDNNKNICCQLIMGQYGHLPRLCLVLWSEVVVLSSAPGLGVTRLVTCCLVSSLSSSEQISTSASVPAATSPPASLLQAAPPPHSWFY